MTQTLPVTQARKEMLELVDKVFENYTRVDITKKGKVKASLVSPEYLESLEETLYTLENSMNDLKEAEEEFNKGEYITLSEFKKKHAR